MDAPRLEPGTVLAGKYRLEQRLGEGGMGTVYRAEHLVLRAPVAVKVIDREVAEGDVTLARFMREAQAAASLRSPHVVQILDYGMEGSRPFMVMELLEGETLASRIERMGRLSPLETYRVLNHVARAVSKAHEAGIVHRDLKPDNVFLVHNEGDEIAKVLDFGVAKIETTSWGGGTNTRTGSLLGTPYYMSPEQAQGNKEIDHRSDLWALGVIAFECLTGVRPFSSDGLGDLVIQICIRDIPVPSAIGEVPEKFDDWFAHAMARDPEHRHQSARELSETLREAMGIARDGSAPESVWSLPAALPAGAASLRRPAAETAKAMAATRADDRATQVESGGARAGSERRISTTADDIPSRPRATLDSEELPRGSQWEVIPGASPSANSRRRYLSEPPPGSSGVRTVVFVALAALLLGGGAVFLLREAGIGVPGIPGLSNDDKPRAVRRTTGRDTSDEPATKGDEKKPHEKTSPTTSPSSSNSGAGLVPPTTPGEATPPETTPTPTEGQSLDEIEAEAARLSGEAAGTGGSSATPSGSGGSAEAPDGPKPEIPEALRPAPTPPPATP